MMTDEAGPATPIRVYLLEDHEAVRRSVAALLEEEPDLQVVGEAATVAHFLSEAPLIGPHVAVLDVRLPDGDGVTACRELRAALPEVRCLMLTSLAEEDALLAAVLGGASGYRLKQVRGTDLATAIRVVARGQSLLDSDTLAAARRRMRAIADAADSTAGLSAPERTILDLIGAGMTNQEIALRLTLPVPAVREHVQALLAKLGVQRLVRPPVAADRRGSP